MKISSITCQLPTLLAMYVMGQNSFEASVVTATNQGKHPKSQETLYEHIKKKIYFLVSI